MACNIQRNYNSKVKKSTLIAYFLAILFTSTQTNASCCCNLSEIFSYFTKRFTHQRPAQIDTSLVMTVSPLHATKGPELTMSHVVTAPRAQIIGLDEAVDEDPTAVQTTLRALIVDDQSVKIQKRFLEQLGFEVTVLTSGVDAIAFFNNGNVVDLVVMDYSMPSLTGFETTQSIRTTHPALSSKFFLHTTDDEETKRAALMAKFPDSKGENRKLFDGQIPKPCTKQELEKAIAPHFPLSSKAKRK